MFFLPISIILFIIFIISLPLLLVLFQIGFISVAFTKLGLSVELGILYFLLSLVGSSINIPLMRRQVPLEVKTEIPFFFRFFLNPNIPKVDYQVIAFNIGGAALPLMMSIYLFSMVPLIETVFATFIIAWVAKLLSRPVQGMGIVLPAFIPPLLSALLAMIFAPNDAPAVAFVSGVLGTLIGADLLNLKQLKRIGPGVVSIGGAGIFDGIYLVGILAVLIS